MATGDLTAGALDGAGGRDGSAVRITTGRLVLREFDETDWPDVLAYQCDARYLRFSHWTDRTADAVQSFVRLLIHEQRQQPRTRYHLAIALAGVPRLIGMCGLRMRSPDAHQADIGFELSPAYWGNGYATEAASALLALGFERLGLHRIWSWCIAENAASARVLERLGLRTEGLLRENEYFKGRWWDTRMFALLDHEWASRTASRPPPVP